VRGAGRAIITPQVATELVSPTTTLLWLSAVEVTGAATKAAAITPKFFKNSLRSIGTWDMNMNIVKAEQEFRRIPRNATPKRIEPCAARRDIVISRGKRGFSLLQSDVFIYYAVYKFL
jgi:hypothetical protein